jgi:leucyl aminopeptidase
VRELPAVSFAAGTVAGWDDLVESQVDALAVPVAPAAEGEDDVQPRTGTADAAARYGIDLARLADSAGLKGAAGETYTFHLPRALTARDPLPWAGLPERLVLVGVGAGTRRDLRRAGAALARATTGLGRVVTTVASEPGPDAPEAVRNLVEGYLLGAYEGPRFGGKTVARSVTSRVAPARELVLLGGHSERSVPALVQARASARATWLVRDLTATPSNIKSPGWMVQQVMDLARPAGLQVTVLSGAELAAQGFGGIVAVGSGSATPPSLVTVAYTPPESAAAPDPRHVVVVGKGITFDTGGLSIKTRVNMLPMKTDMAGSAVALATVLAAAESGIGHPVTAVLALAENAFGAASYRPGDVLRTYSGTTVEILNTDAEGRIVLADALAFADATLEPDVLIDVATLTGAASVGLGRGHAALFSDDPALVSALEAAGEAAGEPVWHMPLVGEYRSELESPVADLRQVPVDKSIGAGSITAALFLQAFVGGRRWAHLDIAGPARSAAAAHEVPLGATGYGARVLMRFLENLS